MLVTEVIRSETPQARDNDHSTTLLGRMRSYKTQCRALCRYVAWIFIFSLVLLHLDSPHLNSCQLTCPSRMYITVPYRHKPTTPVLSLIYPLLKLPLHGSQPPEKNTERPKRRIASDMCHVKCQTSAIYTTITRQKEGRNKM